jgi:hypothetical protein
LCFQVDTAPEIGSAEATVRFRSKLSGFAKDGCGERTEYALGPRQLPENRSRKQLTMSPKTPSNETGKSRFLTL